MMSVQPSLTRSSGSGMPETRVLKFSIRRCCQPGSSDRRPLRVGRAVVAHVDRRRRALEHVELLGGRAEVGHALHGGGAGADDADALAGEPVEAPVGVAAGVVVVPAAGVERVALRTTRCPGMPGSFGRCSGPLAMHTKRARSSSPRLVATIQRARRRPTQRRDLGLEQRRRRRGRSARRCCRLCSRISGARRVLLLRDVADLLEQRQVDVRLDVALRARVAVPVPGAAEVAALLDDADVVDAGLLEAGAGEQAAEAAADDDDVDLVGQRVALDRLDVRIVEVVGEAAR